jgi:hypothetical protein
VKRLLAVIGTTLVLVGGTGAAAATAPNEATPAQVTVTWDNANVTTRVGDRFIVRSRIFNARSAATGSMLAHLNVASLTSDVYVDPEDWSSARTQTLDPLEAGAAHSLTWPIQAVNVGSFDVYVVLLPDGPGSAGKGPLWVSPPVHVEVAGRRTLSAGGALPVVVGVPVLIGLAAGTARLRARHAG